METYAAFVTQNIQIAQRAINQIAFHVVQDFLFRMVHVIFVIPGLINVFSVLLMVALYVWLDFMS